MPKEELELFLAPVGSKGELGLVDHEGRVLPAGPVKLSKSIFILEMCLFMKPQNYRKVGHG